MLVNWPRPHAFFLLHRAQKPQIAAAASRLVSFSPTKVPILQSQQSLSTQRPKWREWFRSFDYDDPWSPYIPFQQKGGKKNSVDKAAGGDVALLASQSHETIVRAVLEGNWQSRRHGMNLEPLSMEIVSQQGESESKVSNLHADYNFENRMINNRLQQEETIFNDSEDNLEHSLVAKTKGKLHGLDVQTRFLCELLDDLFKSGIRKYTDRSKTERCHRVSLPRIPIRWTNISMSTISTHFSSLLPILSNKSKMIGRLLLMTPKLPSQLCQKQEVQIQPHFSFSGLAQRAKSILERMERCSPVDLPYKAINSTTSIEASQLLHTQRPITSRYPFHLLFTKQLLPSPTKKIYTMVLLLFAKERGPLHIAQQAEDVIWSMITRSIQYRKLETNPEKLNIHALPSLENWNCVLTCWSNSSDPDRGLYANLFLRSWLEWNRQYQSHVHSENDIVQPDLTSYCLVLQACLVDASDRHFKSQTNRMTDVEVQRAKKMGTGVAIRFWKEIEKSDLHLDSYTYSLTLQAICQDPQFASSSSNTPITMSILSRIFKKLCLDGLLNVDILDTIRRTLTESQFTQLVEKKVEDETYKMMSSAQILELLPHEWRANAI